jgi:hypothetical protein
VTTLEFGAQRSEFLSLALERILEELNASRRRTRDLSHGFAQSRPAAERGRREKSHG